MASFIKTQRNKEKLIYEGFVYLKSYDLAENKRYWKCEFSKNKSNRCYGAITTDKDNNVTIKQQHNHEPSTFRVELAFNKMVKNEKCLKMDRIYCPFYGERKANGSMTRHFKSYI